MAYVNMSKGPITISRGIVDDGAAIILVKSSAQPRLQLHPKHRIQIPVTDQDMTFADSDLSPEGRAALELLVSEVDRRVLEKAMEKAKQMASDIGVKLDQ